VHELDPDISFSSFCAPLVFADRAVLAADESYVMAGRPFPKEEDDRGVTSSRKRGDGRERNEKQKPEKERGRAKAGGRQAKEEQEVEGEKQKRIKGTYRGERIANEEGKGQGDTRKERKEYKGGRSRQCGGNRGKN